MTSNLLCNDSGAHHGLFDDILTFLRGCGKKRIDITKAKGRASFMVVMDSKVKCWKPRSKMVGGHDDVIYFPFFDSLKDLL
jgi:hypothetical protein